MTNRLTLLAMIAVLLGGGTDVATPSVPGASTWRFDLPPAARVAVQVDLAEVVPTARPVIQRLAGVIAFDDRVNLCHAPAESCSYPNTGRDGRWGIHLNTNVTALTFPANRFTVYHELGHAVWDLLLTPDRHRAFARAVQAALHGNRCLNDQGRPCAVLPEMFADEFARYSGGFAVSMDCYGTPPLLDAGTFGALVDAPSSAGEQLMVRPAFVDGRIVQIKVRADAPNVREDRGITAG
jgi:hypothetical protein